MFTNGKTGNRVRANSCQFVSSNSRRSESQIARLRLATARQANRKSQMPTEPVSHRLRLRGEMELLYFQGRCQGSAAALRFGTTNALRCANHLHVSGRQQFEHALVEAEVADGILDLA